MKTTKPKITKLLGVKITYIKGDDSFWSDEDKEKFDLGVCKILSKINKKNRYGAKK